MNTELQKVKKIVESYTGREAVFLREKPHAEMVSCKMACCWSSPLVCDGFEIAICQPSPQSKTSKLWAFFTYAKEV